MRITYVHRRAARYLLTGMSPQETAEACGVPRKQVDRWLHMLDFKQLMCELEDRYFMVLEKDLDQARRRALAVIMEALNSNFWHRKEWAVERVFLIDRAAQKAGSFRDDHDTSLGKEFQTPEQKRAAIDLLKATPTKEILRYSDIQLPATTELN